MKIYTDLTSLALSLDMATLHRLTTSLLPSHKLFAILRDIYVQLEQGYSFITALKPENMHLFYASSEIAVLATSEAIRLIIQLPLRTEQRTYTVYEPIPLPSFEQNLGKFVQVQTGRQRLAVSSDKRSYMILPPGYIQNCREGNIVICRGTVPIIERNYETCLSSLFFGTGQGYESCSREILSENFRPVFRKHPFENSWLHAVGKLTRVECRCISSQRCPMNITSIEGSGIITQPDGCDLIIGQLTLPASRQFQSTADWDGPGIVAPQTPDLLHPEEVTYLKQHQGLLGDVWDVWEDPEDGSTPDTTPRTMTQLRQQVEARLLTQRWICSGIVTGSLAAATVLGLCLWRHRQALPIFRAPGARGRAIADSTQGNSPDHPKYGPTGGTDREMATEDRQTRDLGPPSETTVFQ
ncbi:hypothetical protein B7P43_G03254 [Cryptotermes secundus]|uniref:Uncharacterized protein n=1 Tax=Cryptotermes secundus TaxID=105785 RepID=A0A2J7RHQ2_9NEOP|nr:hypothetical protein B7P43_G03254 [Cryptotermes secundus]